ncbi:MAG: DUF4080 domain-containing protein, partial [Verrucomicrobiae bacterium]|nr:DUF4080 domain-containing protein [Verrucomicrobiae bacterium]
MPRILLATLNARYLHAAFGLRYLLANLGDLRSEAAIAEFEVQQRPIEIAEAILAQRPDILGLGVYIWNVGPATELVALLRRIRPDLRIVLGGPEVSHETEDQEIVRLADHVITGEADLAFAELCRSLLRPDPASPPPPKIVAAAIPDLGRLALPYDFYSAEDAAHRVIYVEASRGCPFTCEFCLSSLDIPVRTFPLDAFLAAMQRLLDRGVTQFKFVDRTFNLHLPTSSAILRFFLERWRPGLFVHFEMVPDRLPAPLREIIARFPAGALQFEIGIQTLNPEVEERIRRRQDHVRLDDNLRWLRDYSGVHLHADLIAGLPGESLESFAAGFDRLIALGPQEIQVGLLKRLRGTPIGRHDAAFAMRYSPAAPYEVLQTRDLAFETLARLRRFSRFWDLFGNSGLFAATLPLLWRPDRSPFRAFLEFTDALHARGVRTHGVAALRQYELLWEHVTGALGLPDDTVRPLLQSDFRRACRHEMPAWLR